MTSAVLPICSLMLLAAATLALYRLLAGPTLLDRIVGFDMGAICIVGMIALLSLYWKTDVFLEIMVIFSLLGFVGTVAFVSYLFSNPSRLWDRGEHPFARRKKHRKEEA
jgi:multicomponent Na+:H+ antiporter subunit F